MKIGSHRQINLRLFVQAGIVLTIAFAMKLFYATSSVNDLRWILAPTTFFVEVITGEHFWFESYAGYISGDRSFLIADSCSGMNFFIMAFLMLSLMKLQKGLTANVSWLFIPISLLAAYTSTLVANTVRITVAMRLHRMSPDFIWINPDQVHRLEGIFIYFGFLMLLYTLAESVEGVLSGKAFTTRGMLRQSILPLSIYWFTTLGIPVITGAYSKGNSFWEHSLFVIVTPAILILPLAAIKWIAKRPTQSNVDRDISSFRYS